jgi:hypothetical protein
MATRNLIDISAPEHVLFESAAPARRQRRPIPLKALNDASDQAILFDLFHT